MKPIIRMLIVLVISTITVIACSSSEKRSPYNSPESQKAGAKKAQSELSRETK